MSSRSVGQIFKDTGEGAVRGAGWGAGIGIGACVVGALFTGGATLAAIPEILAASAGAGIAGAKLGGGIGALMGLSGNKESINEVGASAAALALAVNGGLVSPEQAQATLTSK